MKRIGNNGFTLIELMVVVTILAILAAIVIPNFMSYRRESHDKACRENKSIIVNACTLRQIQTDEIVTEVSKLTDGKGGVRREPKCPIDGTYTISYDAAKGFSVSCSKDASGGHDTTTTGEK